MQNIVNTYPNAWNLEDKITNTTPVNYQYALFRILDSAHCSGLQTEGKEEELFRDLEKYASGNKTLKDISQETVDHTIRVMYEVALQNPL